jgi:hypothetical protein
MFIRYIIKARPHNKRVGPNWVFTFINFSATPVKIRWAVTDSESGGSLASHCDSAVTVTRASASAMIPLASLAGRGVDSDSATSGPADVAYCILS